MLTKQSVINALDKLPENFSVEDLIERIILISKIEEGIEDVNNGNIFTTEQAKTKLSKWVK